MKLNKNTGGGWQQQQQLQKRWWGKSSGHNSVIPTKARERGKNQTIWDDFDHFVKLLGD